MAYKRAEVVGTTLVEGTLETGSYPEKQQAFGSCLFVSLVMEGTCTLEADNQFEMMTAFGYCVTGVVGEVCKLSENGLEVKHSLFCTIIGFVTTFSIGICVFRFLGH